MKKLLFILFILISVQSFGQFTKFYTYNEYLGVWADSVSNIANRDTVVNPYKIGETRLRLADSIVYIAISTSASNKWIKLRGYYPTGAGTGTVTSVGLSIDGTAISPSGTPVTGSGTIALNWQGAGTDVVLGNGSYTPYSTLITGLTDPLYSPIGHSHIASDISDFVTAARSSFSAGTGISITDGVIAWTGSGSGITSFNGLTGTTQTLAIDTTYNGSASWSSVGTAHTLRLPAKLFDGSYLTANQTITLSGDISGSGATSITTAIGNNKVTDAMLRQSAGLSVIGRSANSTGNVADITAGTSGHVLRRSGTTLAFGTIDSTSVPDLHSEAYYNTKYGSGGGGTWGSITGSLNSQTDLRDSLRNRYISVRAINDTSWAYRKWNGTTYTEDTLVISLANGDKGDITVGSGWTNWTIDNGAVTNAKVATGIDAAKIADGSVSNTEFQYINSVTSNVQTQIDGKQATLVSGTNIKTINGTSLLGSGNISISGGSGSVNDFRELKFKVGVTTNAPAGGDSILVYSDYASKKLNVFREGELQFDSTSAGDYGYERSGDTIKFHPALAANERIIIQAYPDSNWTYDGLQAPAGYDTDAQAYITAQETVDGITLSTTDKDAINQLFLDLKAGSNPFPQGKALYLFYGTTILNALSPTNDDAHFRATNVNGGVISSTGITLDGVNDYLNTHLNPSLNLANQSESYAWYNGIDANTGCDLGVYVGSSGTAIFSRNSGNFLLRLQGGADVNTGANATAIGRYVASIKSADVGGGNYNRRVLKNGSQTYSFDNPANSPINGLITIGAYNITAGGSLGTPGGYRNARYGIFWIGLELTNAQMSQLDTAIANFITATSRN